MTVDPASTERPLILLYGLSGAGKSTAARTLEDLGYLVVDGIPAEAIAALVEVLAQGRPTAFVLDIRCGDLAAARAAAERFGTIRGLPVRRIYLEANEVTLRRRYTETRRPHPADDGCSDLSDILDDERLAVERTIARDEVMRIGTDGLAPSQLGDAVRRAISGAEPVIPLHLYSFGHKHGPPDAPTIALDARGLPNPYWDAALRPGDGRDAAVAAFALEHEQGRAWLAAVERMVVELHALSSATRGSFDVAIGCTGGRHRSVAAVEALAARLRDRGLEVRVSHRDLGRQAPAGRDSEVAA